MTQVTIHSLPAPGPLSAWERRMAFLLVLLAILCVQLQQEHTNGPQSMAHQYRVTLEDYMEPGKAQRFYQARPLMRWVISGLSEVTGWSHRTSHELIQVIFLAGALLMAHRLFRYYLNPTAALGAAMLVGAWIPWSFLNLAGPYSYAYDYPALFFSVAGIAAILQDRRWLLLGVIALGTWNKESTFWLLGGFFFSHLRLQPRWQDGAWLLAYTLVFFGGYFGSRLLVTGGPGGGHMVLYQNNLREALLFLRSTQFQNVYLALAPHAVALIGWSVLPRDLRLLYLGALGVFFPAQFVLGSITEVRIFHDVLPLAALGVFAQAPGGLRRHPDLETELPTGALDQK